MSFLDNVDNFFEDVTDLTSRVFDNTAKVVNSVQGFANGLTNAELTTSKPAVEQTVFGNVQSSNILIAGAAIVGVFALIALIKS